MGSSGSGQFGSYKIGNNVNQGATNGIGIEEGTNEVECPIKIENIRLEDVAISEYFNNHNKVPMNNTKVRLRNTIYQGRLVIETLDSKEIIGNMPIKYNYLINCFKEKQYLGSVISSGINPIPFVVVTLNA